MLPLDCGLEFDPARDEEFFASLPARPGVLVLELHSRSGNGENVDAPPQSYLARTADLRRVAERLLRVPGQQPARRLNLRELARAVRYRITGSPFEQCLAAYQHARVLFPHRYRDFLRLRPPALLKVNLRNDYPRCYITRRILGDGGFYFGPFASRKGAESFANNFLDLFKIRRCQIKIRRDPSFPGCIYSEIKMCLAPCFAGCSSEEYAAETERVLETLDTRGAALTVLLEGEREAASAALEFERAALTQKKLEKAAAVMRGLPELPRRLDHLDTVVLQRAAESDTVAVFAVRGGRIRDPLMLRFGELSSRPRSLEEMLRAYLEPETMAQKGSAQALAATPVGISAEPRFSLAGGSEKLRAEVPLAPELGSADLDALRTPLESPDYRARFALRASPEGLEEHLSLLARWFYSKPRQGEMFFFARGWPYRRIIRACSRVLHLQPPAVGAPPPQA